MAGQLSRRAFLALSGGLLASCGGSSPGDRTQPPTSGATNTAAQRTPTAPAPISATPTVTIAATVTPITATVRAAAPRPAGFPLDPATRLGVVQGQPGARRIAWGEGPAALTYSRDDQPASDPVRANRCGWNARVHVEYEGEPAVDWYIPVGTPVLATMDGSATLLVNTVANPFDAYAVSREPYLGNPDRSRAPMSPFPGLGGGQGVFMRVENDGFRTDYAHLEPSRTVKAVPAGAWLPGFSADAVAGGFAALRDYRVATATARWAVKRGDVIGFSGDTGYSEAPHLHYAIRPAGSSHALCPTREPGFEDSGWLFRA